MNTKQILSYFIEEAADFEVRPFGSGHIHDTYLASSAKQSFIVQRINTLVFQQPVALMDNIHQINTHLKAANYNLGIAELHATKDAALFHCDEQGDYWRVFSFLTDTYSIDQVSTPEQAYQAAKAFGHFLQALQSLPTERIQETIPDFHNCKNRQRQFQQSIQADSFQRLKRVDKEVRFLQALTFCQSWSQHHLPSTLCHNDTKINNLLFDRQSGKVRAVIDLDTVMPGSPLFDFGDMVRTFTNAAMEDETVEKVQMRLPIFDALCQGFGEAYPLSVVEKEQALLAACLIVSVQAKRFLSDFLNGDIYYKIHYPDQNLQRARNQIALLQSILAQEEEMKAIIQQYL